jgi:hypothetical protein
MPWYFRFGVGPFRFSQRVGRTQAPKRADAKTQAQRERWRTIVSLNGIGQRARLSWPK